MTMPLPDRQYDSYPQLLHDFYQLLVLLRVFGPYVGPRTSAFTPDGASMESMQSSLRIFLNRLAHVCDYAPGGRSVTAIALERGSDCSIFWISTRAKTSTRSKQYLEKVVAHLRDISQISASAVYDLERKICNDSIEFAAQKVKNYKRLFLKYKKDSEVFLDSSDLLLLQDLSRLSDLAHAHSELCAAADRFRDGESFKSLSRRVSLTTGPSNWSYLRHYIGRLGSWHRASYTLVQFARSRPDIFQCAEVRVIESPKSIPAPFLQNEESIKTVMSRMYAPEDQQKFERNIQAVQDGRTSNLNDDFQTECGNEKFKPFVHAEVMLLEHFHNGGRTFVDNDKYIGCSKPSCYCCGLYFHYHPGGFAPRPTHGNVWKKWQPPLHAFEETQTLNQLILLEMIRKFQQDLKTKLGQPVAKQLVMPDSVGFTLSATQKEHEDFDEEELFDD